MGNWIVVVHAPEGDCSQYLIVARSKCRISHARLTVGKHTCDSIVCQVCKKRRRDHTQCTAEAVPCYPQRSCSVDVRPKCLCNFKQHNIDTVNPTFMNSAPT